MQNFLLAESQFSALRSDVASLIEYELWLNDLQEQSAHRYGCWFGAEFEAISYQKLVSEYLGHHQVAAVACKLPQSAN